MLKSWKYTSSLSVSDRPDTGEKACGPNSLLNRVHGVWSAFFSFMRTL